MHRDVESKTEDQTAVDSAISDPTQIHWSERLKSKLKGEPVGLISALIALVALVNSCTESGQLEDRAAQKLGSDYRMAAQSLDSAASSCHEGRRDCEPLTDLASEQIKAFNDSLADLRDSVSARDYKFYTEKKLFIKSLSLIHI